MKRTFKIRIALLVVFVVMMVIMIFIIRHSEDEGGPVKIESIQKCESNGKMGSSSFRNKEENEMETFVDRIKNSRKEHSEKDTEEPISEERRRILELASHYNLVLGDAVMEMASSVLDEMLAEEMKDEEWNEDVDNDGRRLLAGSAFKGTSLKEVNCGTTICKASFSHPDVESRIIFQDNGSSLGPWGEGHQVGGNFDNTDGTPGTYVFFSRDKDFMPFLIMRERIALKMGVALVPR